MRISPLSQAFLPFFHRNESTSSPSGNAPQLVLTPANYDFLYKPQAQSNFSSTSASLLNQTDQASAQSTQLPAFETVNQTHPRPLLSEDLKEQQGNNDTSIRERRRPSYPGENVDRRVRMPGFREDSNITYDENKKPYHGYYNTKTHNDDGSSGTVNTQYRFGAASTTMRSDDNKGKIVYTTDKTDSWTGDREVVERTRVNGQLRKISRRFETDSPDRTLPGIPAMWDNHPAQLKSQFPKDAEVSTTRTSETTIDSTGKRHTEKKRDIRTDDRSVMLTSSSSSGGGTSYTLKKLDEDGLYDEQFFLQGTKDTVVTKRSRENGFTVEQTTSSWPTLSRKDENIPKEAEGTLYEAGQVSPKQLGTMLRDDDRLAMVRESDSFQTFMGDNSGGKLKVMASSGSWEDKNGKQTSANLVVEDSGGRRLLAVYDRETKSYMVSRESADGQLTQASLIGMQDGLRKKLEIQSDGSVESSSKAATALMDGRGWAKNAEDAIDVLGEVKKTPGGRANNSTGSLPTESVPVNWKGPLNRGLAGVSALSLGISIAQGDDEKAYASGAALGLDISAILQGEATKSSSTTRAAGLVKASKVFGTAGLILSTPAVYTDFSQGRPLSGGLKVVGIGGTAAALYGAGTPLGPAGWVAATAATAASFPVDYNNSRRIAPVEI